MDDTFDQLDQAAVAGAEGTAWPIADLSSVASLPPPSCFGTFDAFDPDDTSDSTVAVMSHFHHSSAISAPIPIPTASPPPPKIEPLIDAFMPDIPASPITPSLCSVGSSAPTHPSRAFVPVRQPRKRRVACQSLSTSPTSIAIPCSKSQVATTCSPSSVPSCTPCSAPPPPLAKSPVSSSDAAMRDASPSPSPSPSPATSFCAHDLTDLSGTTAARSRKMTEDERKVMLHKRRLRNRASAARSREKRSRTLNDLTCEVEDLMLKSARLAQQASQALEEARKLRAKNVMLAKENELLKSELKL